MAQGNVIPYPDSVETFSVQCVAGWSVRSGSERSIKVGNVVEITLLIDIPSANQNDKVMEWLYSDTRSVQTQSSDTDYID